MLSQTLLFSTTRGRSPLMTSTWQCPSCSSWRSALTSSKTRTSLIVISSIIVVAITIIINIIIIIIIIILIIIIVIVIIIISRFGLLARCVPQGPPAPRVGRGAADRGAGTALASAVVAATASTAASQPLTALGATQGQATNAVVVLADNLSLVWVIGLCEFALMVVVVLVMTAAAGACACWWCSRTVDAGAGRQRGTRAEEEEGTQAGKPAKRSRTRRGRMDAGVQGPVHYDGTRYVHRSQGHGQAASRVNAPPAAAWRR